MDISFLEKQLFRKLISNPDILVKNINRISAEDFTTPLIKEVVAAFIENSSMLSQYCPNTQFFEILLRDRIHKSEDLVHASSVLAGMASTPVDAKDIDMLLRELKANRMCRELTQIIQKNIPAIKPDSVEDAYEEMVKDLLQLPLMASSGKTHNKTHETHDEIEARVMDYLNPAETRISTGLKAFDSTMGGFAYGELVLISAGTAQGKSNLMMWWAEQFVEVGYNILYVTIEMSYEANLHRYHAIQTGFDTLDIAHKRIPKTQQHVYFEKLIAASKDKDVRKAFLRECESIKDRSNPIHALAIAKKYINRKSKMFILDAEGCAPARVEQEIQRLSMDQKIDAVFVDFINVMDPDFHNKDRVRELASISRELKKVARKTKTVLVTAAQLDTTALEHTQEEELTTDHVKYSKAIAENADWMIAFNRTEEDNVLKQVRLQLAKHRSSPRATALIEFDFGTMQAVDLGFAPGTFVPYGYNQHGDKLSDMLQSIDQKKIPSFSDIEPIDVKALSKLAVLPENPTGKVGEIFQIKSIESKPEIGNFDIQDFPL